MLPINGIPAGKKFHYGLCGGPEGLYITDISFQDCQIFFEKKSEGNQKDLKLEIRVEIPEYENQEILYTLVKGEVVWEKILEDFMILGIQFNKLDRKNASHIRKIVHYWNFLNSTFGYLEDLDSFKVKEE